MQLPPLSSLLRGLTDCPSVRPLSHLDIYDVMNDVMSSVMNKSLEIILVTASGTNSVKEFIEDLE